MCTVTFVPLGNDQFVLTSNRDVSYKRAAALPPITYIEDEVELLYPKDGKAGGTWIGCSRRNRLICLLNGGFENHVRRENYRKSRGIIVKDLLITEDLRDELEGIDLTDIEPFTLVTVEWKSGLDLRQFVWDGADRHLKILTPEPRIWSSSTLFDPKMIDQRITWFNTWKSDSDMNPETVLEFHETAGNGDADVGVVLKREHVGTVSITQFTNQQPAEMKYWAIRR